MIIYYIIIGICIACICLCAYCIAHNIFTPKRIFAYFLIPTIIYKVKRDEYCKKFNDDKLWVRNFPGKIKIVFYYDSIYETYNVYKNDGLIASWKVYRGNGLIIYNFFCYSKEFNTKSLKPIYEVD